MNVACDYEAPMQMLTTEKYIATRPREAKRILTVLIHNLKTTWSTKMLNIIFEVLCQFALRCIYLFSKRC